MAATVPSESSAHQTSAAGPAAADATTSNGSISAEEIALYDRQIRLWGVQAQEHLRKANVLLVSMKALANEVAKNLVLAGIRSLTIIDHHVCVEEDLSAQFFLTQDDVDKNRAEAAAPRVQELNPRVNVDFDTGKIKDRIQDQSYLIAFDLVIATDTDYSTLLALNTACRLANKPFYAAGSHGVYGYIFADLVIHDYVMEGDIPNIPHKPGQESLTRSTLSVSRLNGKQQLAKREIYSPIMLANSSPLHTSVRNSRAKLRKITPLLSCQRALWDFEARHQRAPMAGETAKQDLREFTIIATEKHNELGLPADTLKAEVLRSFLGNIYAQIAPATAMLGGMLAQDAINVIGKREQPIQNLCLFDGEEYNTPVYTLHPGNYEDGTALANGTAPVVAAAAVASGEIVEL